VYYYCYYCHYDTYFRILKSNPGDFINKAVGESRHESRARHQHRRGFFFGFMFEPRNRRELSNFAQTRHRPRRAVFDKQPRKARTISRNIHTTPQQPTPLKFLELCVPWRFWAHVFNTCSTVLSSFLSCPPPPLRPLPPRHHFLPPPHLFQFSETIFQRPYS
jgi:hypothetical protein